MKSARFLPLFLLALSFRPADAQVAAKPANATPIRYSRAVPKSVLKGMPHGAKSLFWGTFSPKKGGATLAIHLMRSETQTEVPGSVPQLRVRHYVIGLLKKSHEQWKEMVHTPIPFKTSFREQDNLSLDAKFYWINEEKKIPLIAIRAFEKDGGYGPIGDEVFVSFAGGWSSSPAVQAFSFGSWFASDSIGQSNTLEVDEHDVVEILARIFPASDSPPAELRFVWSAERGKFWPDEASQKRLKRRLINWIHISTFERFSPAVLNPAKI